MEILVIGSHGKVGKYLVKFLSEAHEVRAMVRDKSQVPEMESLGGKPVVANLEEDFSHAVKGADVVVFTAGSGGHTGPDKTILVDLLGAFKAVDESKNQGVKRFLMVSTLGTDDPNQKDEKRRHYFVAKAEADKYLINSGLSYTIFRPGRLLDDAGTGNLDIGVKTGNSGTTRREDLAKAIALSLSYPATENKTLDLLDGNRPMEESIEAL